MRKVYPSGRRRLLGAAVAVVVTGGVLVTAASFVPAEADIVSGASLPFVSYEAEAGALGGGATTVSLTAAPTTQYSSPALEASRSNQNPADGNPRVFFDEVRTFVTGAAIASGSTFSLRKDAANTAAFYHVDVVDVEDPPAPATQPANSISITS